MPVAGQLGNAARAGVARWLGVGVSGLVAAWIHRLNWWAFLTVSSEFRADVSVSGAAVIGRSARLFHWVLWSRPLGLGDQAAAAGVGGPVVAVSKSCCHPGCQGQSRGRCRVGRRPEVAMRAGTLIRCARRDAVVALLCSPPASAPAVRVRLNAMTAHCNQAALA